MGATEPHHRLDAVTVRIGIPPDEIAQAERVLGLDPQTARQTWLRLCETPADGRSRALASSGSASVSAPSIRASAWPCAPGRRLRSSGSTVTTDSSRKSSSNTRAACLHELHRPGT